MLYKIPHKQKYFGGNPLTLVDGLTGTTSYNDGYWQGWEGENLDVVSDLGKPEIVNQIAFSFLESQRSWIFLPTKIKVSFSMDGETFTDERSVVVKDGERNGDANRQISELNGLQHSAQFIRIQAINRKTCPDWHDGAGGKAWIFADEIVVE